MDELLRLKAEDLGRLLGQSAEYSAVERSRQRLEDDRGMLAALSRLADLEGEIAAALRRGEEPSDGVKTEYEQVFSTLQSSPVYQEYVAAQSNFDKKLLKVNEEISRGMESGSRSRIILPT